MSEKIVSAVISALVGGAVGAAVVFFVAGKSKFETLEVGSLKITKDATLLNAEGKEDVVLKDGSVLANNVILGKKFIGTQYQGHVMVANRMFTSPDDLVATPMESWRFYTEMGASNETGGEVIVRSPSGANVVGQPVNNGVFLRTGFDKSDNPQLFARVNQNGVTLPVPFMRPQAPAGQGAPAEGTAGQPAEGQPAVAEAEAAPVR